MPRPTQAEIDEQLNRADDQIDNGTKYPGIAFEEGVAQTIRWLLEGGEPPMEDD